MHDNGWQTIYAHLNRFSGVLSDAYVKAGDIIGYAGSTGNSTGVHLHFGLRREGFTYVDSAGTAWPWNIFDPTPYLYPHIAYDLLPYLRGDGRIYRMVVLWRGQRHEQQVQTQVSGDRFYHVKNREWEELWADTEFVYRGCDTSPGENRYYTQRQNPMTYGARWSKRFVVPGDVYERNPLIVWADKTTGATIGTPGYHRSWLKVVRFHPTWRAQEGLSFSDVAELHWLLKPDAATAAEKYFYARNWGLVGWSSSEGNYSFVAEQLPNATPFTREVVPASGFLDA